MLSKKATYYLILFYSFWLYFFYLMLEITLKYIPIKSDAAFLQIKQDEVTEIKPYLTIFYIHVYSAIFVLLFGVFQFNSYVLKKYKNIHKIFGKLYFYILILFAAPSGIFIGYYANGGISSQISFILLGILWLYFTIKAIIFIKSKNIIQHKNYMMRSYALTVSAITLRFWKVIIVFLFQPQPMDVYQIVAWLGWLPNLFFVEYLIRKKRIFTAQNFNNEK